MGLPPALSSARSTAHAFWDRAWANGEHKLLTRYLLVSGAFGLPASIISLQIMIWGYESFVGDYNRLTLNAMWILNFEIGLMRNFFLHCAFTWKTNPTRKRMAHIHVAAIGAFVIDLSAFNIVLLATETILIAQVIGASSGFFCNFLYNRLRTFGAPQRAADEALVEGSIV
ncbi:MAG: GtrA family protein [Dehalococcoidia bacterium]